MRNKYKNKGSMAMWLIVALVVIVLGVAVYSAVVDTGATDTDELITYRNEQFNFELQYPEGWIVEEFAEDSLEPRINFYPPDVNPEQPLTHQSEVQNVSVFPRGIPTEGVFGQTENSKVNFALQTQQAVDFVLEDGSVWATYANFESVPSAWGPAGFVWSRVDVQNSEVVCLRADEEIIADQCDPLDGDQIVRRGSVSEEDQKKHENILKSFKFIGDDISNESDNNENATGTIDTTDI